MFSQPQPQLPQEVPPPQENRRMRMMRIQSQLLLQELQNIIVFLSPHRDLRDRAGAGRGGAASSVSYYDDYFQCVKKKKEGSNVG